MSRFDEVDKLKKTIVALKVLVKMVEFSDSDTCPVCGGNQHHDSACCLAAMIYPEKKESYRRETLSDAENDLLFAVENTTKYAFLLDELRATFGEADNDTSI